MSVSLEQIDACLPITGLKALTLNNNTGGNRLIFQGQGPYSRLVDEETGKLLAELRTFKRNNVYGFLISRHELLFGGGGEGKGEEKEKEYVQVICWGGQSLRVIDLVCFRNHHDDSGLSASLSSASAEYLAPDWIMSGCVVVDGAGTAIATDEESNAESRRRTTTTMKTTRACLVTAHNALLDLNVVDIDVGMGKPPQHKKAIRLRQVATGTKSILYSADTVSLSTTHTLVAAGTVFGEIIVWSCYLDGPENGGPNEGNSSSDGLSSIHHFFTGHEGSIFGVRISPNVPALHSGQSGRLLASCSDDRTVRIWDISDCERTTRQDPPAYATDGFELRSTGFGSGNSVASSESCLASAFGHGARIWGVNFLPTAVADGQNGLKLISHGEDAICLVWDLSWAEDSAAEMGETKFRLYQASSFHHHSGKNVWSLEICNVDGDAIVYTGGADGALKTMKMHNVLPATAATPQIETNTPLRAFSFVAHDCLIAVTPRGEVKLGWIGPEMTPIESGMKPHVSWETLCVAEDLAPFSNVSSSPEMGLALLANSQGLIRLYSHSFKSLSTIARCEQRPLGLFILRPEPDSSSPSDSANDTLYFMASYAVGNKADLFRVDTWKAPEPRIDQSVLVVPPKFQANCASFVYDNQYIAVGSTDGWLAMYSSFTDPEQPSERLERLIYQRRVHGIAGICQITSMSSLTGEAVSPKHFVTCGRDAEYCIHEIIKPTNDSTGEPIITLVTVYRSSQSLILNMRGLYFDKTSHDLMLYGFRSRQFILWNESTQTEVASVDCGGPRRNWAFIVAHSRRDGSDGVLVWDKCRDFNGFCIQPRSHRSLRAGGHGREIKSMDVWNNRTVKEEGGGRSTLFATAAEDTTVRIFRPRGSSTEGPWGTFECLRVLNNHGSGLQQVSWSRDGEYLFSSSGNEDFFVWKIAQVPGFGVTAALVGSNPKEDPNSDLRVTSFDMLEVEEEQEGPRYGFLFCLTYSNSTIKVFHFSPSVGHGRFTLLAKGRYTSNCLMQAQIVLKSTSVSLITAATDGHITLWDLTSVLEPFYSIVTPSSSSSSLPALSAKRSFQETTVATATISCENRYQIHSSSIKCLELVHISDATSLAIAGGDDNALTISLLRMGTETSSTTHVTTISIPDAHAAAITTIRLLRKQPRFQAGTGPVNAGTDMLLASSGNDQRVKIWSIQVDGEDEDKDEDNRMMMMDIRMVQDRYSAVADISCLDVIDIGSEPDKRENEADSTSTTQTGFRLLVCGVGMEMLDMRLA